MAKKQKNRDNKENLQQPINFAHLEETVKKNLQNGNDNVPNITEQIKNEVENYMMKHNNNPFQIAQNTINLKKGVKENT